MKIRRRPFIFGLGAVLAAGTSPYALAQSGTPLRIVVPYAPGGAADLTARLIAQRLGERLARPVVVDNKAGASGQLGIQHVVRSDPDGNTIVLSPSGSISISGHFQKLPYDTVKDLSPLALLVYVPSAIAVTASSPYHTLNDLIEAAKRSPTGISYGIPGFGTHMHLSGELLATMTGAKLVPVPYRGDAPSVAAVAAGEIPACVAGLSTMLPMAKAGRIRILAVTNSERTSTAPDIPTASEVGVKGYSANAWMGMFAPAGTPAVVVERLNAELTQIMQSADIKALLEGQGLEPAKMSTAQFRAFLAEDTRKWGSLIKEKGIKAD